MQGKAAAGLRGWFGIVGAVALALLSFGVKADVDRVEVLTRGVVADGKAFGNVGPYEWLRGRLYLTEEAGAGENQAVVDIKLAPRDGQGRVHFATDFMILLPLDAKIGRAHV